MKFPNALLRFRQHWPLVLLAAISAIFIFANLGSDYLWEDEGDTAALAVNILKFGVPKAWDGAAFLDSDHGARLNRDLVMVTHPWVQYYLAAGSFLLFGQNTLAARLPFAVAAWWSVLLLVFSVLLFHPHPYGIAPVVALGGLSFIYRPFNTQRRWIWFAAPAIA